MTENVLIVGATGGIARALSRVMAARGCNLVLAGRDRDALDAIAVDLRLRNAVRVEIESFDALDAADVPKAFGRCAEKFSEGLQGIVLCHGWMAPQATSEADPDVARRMIDVNFTAAAILLGTAANYFAERKSGYLAAISSVAGDRGRMSNYVYGAAKAGLSAFLQGLRNRMQHQQVHVLNIKPGFVDTPMTAGLLAPNSKMVATPERVARDIDRAIRRRQNTLYTPWFWRPIMAVIRSLPEAIFKRLRL